MTKGPFYNDSSFTIPDDGNSFSSTYQLTPKWVSLCKDWTWYLLPPYLQQDIQNPQHMRNRKELASRIGNSLSWFSTLACVNYMWKSSCVAPVLVPEAVGQPCSLDLNVELDPTALWKSAIAFACFVPIKWFLRFASRFFFGGHKRKNL
jgi:hypothetical protein